MKRVHILTAICVVVSLSCLGIGAWLLAQPNNYDAPDMLHAEALQPVITVTSSRPYRQVLVLADFRDADEYQVQITSGSLNDLLNGSADAASIYKKDGPVTVAVRITAQGPFQWSHLNNLQPRKATAATRATSVPIAGTGGSGSYVLLRGTLSADHPSASFDFSTSTAELMRYGPWVRVGLPSIETGDFAAEDQPLTNSSMTVPQGLSAGSLDGLAYYAPDLYMYVDASPFDQLNGSLVVQHMTPAPVYEPPLAWQVRARFLPDVLYRDSDWDRHEANFTVIAGILIGLGGAALIIPLASMHAESLADRRQERLAAERS